MLFEGAVGIILVQGLPAGFTGLEDGGHVYTVAVAFAEHGVGLFPIVHVDHDGGVGDMDLHIFPVNTEACSGPEHIPDDALAAGAAFHHELAGVQNEFHLIPDGKGRIGY